MSLHEEILPCRLPRNQALEVTITNVASIWVLPQSTHAIVGEFLIFMFCANVCCSPNNNFQQQECNPNQK